MALQLTFDESHTAHASVLMIDGPQMKLFHTTGSGVASRGDMQLFRDIVAKQFIRDARAEGFSEQAISNAFSEIPRLQIGGRSA